MKKRVVITGLGLVSPLGCSVKHSWTNILQNKSGIRNLDPVKYAGLPCQIGGEVCDDNSQKLDLHTYFKSHELRSMSPASAYALLAAKQAIDDSKIHDFPEEEKSKIGVALGTGMVDLNDICATNDCLKRGYNQVNPYFVPRILLNMPAGLISMRWGFRGPNHTVSTACATGAHSIGDSLRFIRNGDAEIMVCGGTEASLNPLAVAGFCRLRALATTYNDRPQAASRPFDSDRCGFVMGEGSAILVLEHLEHALRRNIHIYAEILGYGLSADASHLTAPRADGTGALRAMQNALEDAQVTPEDISYINAHATSTPIGDVIELLAIKKLFGDHCKNIRISSTKGAHGHLLGSAGSLESIFTIKAIETKEIPRNLNLENIPKDILVPPECLLDPEFKDSTKRRIGLKNAFGFGGTNASLCFGQYPF